MEARSTTRLVPVESWEIWWRRKRSIPNERDHLVGRLALGPLGPPAQGIWRVEDSTPTGRPASWVNQQHLLHAELGEEPAVLEGAHDPEGGPLLGQVLDQALAVEPHRAGLGGHQPRDHVEHGGLARPVGPDQPDDGTGLGRQVGAVDRLHAAEGHRHALQVEPGRAPRAAGLAPDGRLTLPPRWPPAPTAGSGRPGGGGVPRRVAELLDAQGDQVAQPVEQLGQAAGEVEDEGQQPEPAGEELDGRVGAEDGREADQVDGPQHGPVDGARAPR